MVVGGGCVNAMPWAPCPAPVFDTEAHRGGTAHRPENTLPAMAYALTRGVHSLEMDLAVTADDVLVLSHDPVLGALCKGPDGETARDVAIRDLTLAQVRQYDCGSLPPEEFPEQQPVPGTPPPTLLEVFSMAETRSGGTIRYNLEIKSRSEWDGKYAPSPQRFVELVEQAVGTAGVGARVQVQSFDPRPLRALQQRKSALRRALLLPTDQLGLYKDASDDQLVSLGRSLGVETLSTFAPLTRRPLVDLAHAHGLAVVAWTVNGRVEMERLINIGVDGIISDNVDLLVEVTREKKPRGGVCF
jgi:glycerophosphoryl diester phosphodiesterase